MSEPKRYTHDSIEWEDPAWRKRHGLVKPREALDSIDATPPTETPLWKEPSPVSPQQRLKRRTFKRLVTEADDMEPEWGQG